MPCVADRRGRRGKVLAWDVRSCPMGASADHVPGWSARSALGSVNSTSTPRPSKLPATERADAPSSSLSLWGEGRGAWWPLHRRCVAPRHRRQMCPPSPHRSSRWTTSAGGRGDIGTRRSSAAMRTLTKAAVMCAGAQADAAWRCVDTPPSGVCSSGRSATRSRFPMAAASRGKALHLDALTAPLCSSPQPASGAMRARNRFVSSTSLESRRERPRRGEPRRLPHIDMAFFLGRRLRILPSVGEELWTTRCTVSQTDYQRRQETIESQSPCPAKQGHHCPTLFPARQAWTVIGADDWVDLYLLHSRRFCFDSPADLFPSSLSRRGPTSITALRLPSTWSTPSDIVAHRASPRRPARSVATRSRGRSTSPSLPAARA